jgi:hypothetical protein
MKMFSLAMAMVPKNHHNYEVLFVHVRGSRYMM